MKSISTIVFTLSSFAGAARGLPSSVACTSLQPAHIEGASVINSTAEERYNITGAWFEGSVNVCAMTTYLTHGDAGDEVRVEIWLPLDPVTPWNGYFQGTAGAGFTAGYFDLLLGPAVVRGYAAGSTDAGVGMENTGENRTIPWTQNDQLVTNFAHLSIHEMTIIGKAATADFYNQAPSRAFFAGCSLGGQQGHVEAQRYPDDYDGILSEASPTNLPEGGMAVFWAYLVQSNGEGGFLGSCKLDAFQKAVISHCDLLDGAEDGIISHPPDCDFDPQTLVGNTVACDDGSQVITQYDAETWQRIHQGPPSRNGSGFEFGIPYDASFQLQAAETLSIGLADWITNFLLHQPDYDISTIDEDLFWDLWDQSVETYSDQWNANNPDLGPFQASGGKMIAWHGWADSSVTANGLPFYWSRVKEALGGDEAVVDQVYRAFMAPGVDHCQGGLVPAVETLNTLVDWVVNGNAPETLPININGARRRICKHPAKLHHRGNGTVGDPNGWECI